MGMPLHAFLSSAASFVIPHSFISSLIRYPHVFLPCLYILRWSQTNFYKQTPIHPFVYALGDQTISNVPVSPHLQPTQHPSAHSVLTRYSILETHPTHPSNINQISLPYTITLCTQALYTFPFTFRRALAVVNTGANFLNFAQALLTFAKPPQLHH